MPATIITTIMAFAIAGLGGALFQLAGVPLPWLLGAIVASATAASLGNRWPMPQGLRLAARPVVGVLAGASFTPAILGSLAAWAPALIVIVLYSLVVSVIGYLLFTRLWRLDPVTAYFASAPGGLSELSLIGSEAGGDMKALVVIHAIRVLSIVCLIPLVLQFGLGLHIGSGLDIPRHGNIGSPGLLDWLILTVCGLAGYWLGRRWVFPGSILILAMATSAAVHVTGLTTATPPGALLGVVQVLVGAIAGSRFAGLDLVTFARIVRMAIIWGLTMMVLAFGMAHLMHLSFGLPFVTLLLAIVPGGTMEMLVIGYILAAEVAFIALCHIVRLVLVQVGAPIAYALLKDRIGR